MKRLILILMIGILVFNGLGAIYVTGKEVEQEKITFTFSNLKIKENFEHIVLELVGANSQLLKKDHYIIPERIATFSFPFGTEIVDMKCNPKNIHQKHLGKELKIAPNPIIAGQSSYTINNEKPEDPVFINTWYEYSVGCGLIGSQRKIIVKVEVFPIQYHPSENSFDWAEEIEIEILYNEPELPITTFNDEYDFIIITPSKYSEELNSLVNHKNNRGVSTKLVTLNDIYSSVYFPVEGRDNPEKIKYFIKNSIENWDIRYVLLVGGADDFPTRETHVYVDYNEGDAEIFVSDLYYADVYTGASDFSSWDTNENNDFGEYNWGESQLTDDVDLYPDIYLGRLACIESSDVTTCINKIITYETNEAYSQDWFTNLVVIGGDTSPNDEEGILEGEFVNQNIIDIMDGFIPTKCWASEGTLGTRTSINTAINSGAGFVDFSGHGNPTLWSTHPFNSPDIWIPVGSYKNTHVSSLNNGDELPIVVTGACSVAKFNVKSDCFTWSFISNPKGGGIASIGPAALSWGYDTSYTIRALGGKMQLELFKAYKVHGAYTFGEMWAQGISNYITPRRDGGDYKTIEEWQPFGDPTLAIADESLPPEKPGKPNGKSSGGINTEYSFTASTTDPDGDRLYYLFDWGDDSYSGWIGPINSGQTIEASHKWIEKGTYQIKVKAKDVHGIQSDWSDPLPFSTPKNKIIGNPLLRFIENHARLFLIFIQQFGF